MFATFQRQFQRFQRSAFAIPVAVLAAVLMLGISESTYQRADDLLTQLGNMAQVRLELARLLRRMTDAESGQRGYLLTNGADYLDPYRHASLDVLDAIAKLQALYSARQDMAGLARLARLTEDARTKLSELDEVITLHDNGRVSQARELMLFGIGRDRMDDIRSTADLLLATENQRVAQSRSATFTTLQISRIGVAATTLISLLLLALFLRQSRQLDRQRDALARQVLAERDHLEAEVGLRTVELTALARHQENTREDERARLARDLHDELGALLTAAKLDLARMRPKLAESLPELLPRVAHLVETLNSGIALKRRIIEDLRPSTLDNLGLLPALEVLCQESAERLGLPVITDLQPVRLTASAQLTVFRLVQESLNNIAKHARASEVRVSLHDAGARVALQVRDNGVGFDPADIGSARHGLIGMRYRVQAEHGQLTLDAAPGQGVSLRASLPQQALAESSAAPPAGSQAPAIAQPGGA